MISAVIGSRSFCDYDLLVNTCVSRGVSGVVSGGAVGADSLAARFARSFGLPLQVFVPNYRRFGRSAPLLRNHDIVSSCEQVIAFWDGCSKGCSHTLACAKKLGIPSLVVRF